MKTTTTIPAISLLLFANYASAGIGHIDMVESVNKVRFGASNSCGSHLLRQVEEVFCENFGVCFIKSLESDMNFDE